ncbi:MAG TPA: M14 family metallopeptidase [Caulobacteraceae bacterium]|nr:M14 family metallopeptidase [Caulobacteraceae bacterium]
MNSAESFSASYREAHIKFEAAAREAGAALDDHPHSEKGPDGERLATTSAWLGPPQAMKVLVMISGTHGAEGFCGAGAQVDFLRRGEHQRLPKDAAILMIHAINPFGFAWLRRVTEDNVDLNRNWIDFDQPLPANPGYDALAEVICPPSWSPAAQEESAAALQLYARQNGAMALQQAVSGGQYDHPDGVFYGGAAPTWSRLTQTRIMQDRLENAAHVAIIDYHTGLGPWGYGERILTDAPGSDAHARAKAWWGEGLTSTFDGSSTSAEVKGDGLAAAAAILPRAEVTGIALEFGTLSLEEVLTAVRADAWLHAHSNRESGQWAAIKRQVRDAFYGDADDWKGMIAGQSLIACRQALAALDRA